jgi:hypothetical protein
MHHIGEGEAPYAGPFRRFGNANSESRFVFSEERADVRSVGNVWHAACGQGKPYLKVGWAHAEILHRDWA